MAKPKKKQSFKKAPRIGRPARSAKPRTRKVKADGSSAGPGHNLSSVKKVIGPFFTRYNNLLNEKDSMNASFMADARVIIEDAANDLGAPKSVVRMALQDKRRDLKREAKEKVMNPGDVDTLHTFQAALGVMSDTPLGLAAVERKKQELAETETQTDDHQTEDQVEPEPEFAEVT